ncbi:hypothetical protein HQ544_01185 [Candidatus Falkowbacteria bacterium]|nr:hypothetical protein [Candidatus Falkowbacteria bacterium]
MPQSNAKKIFIKYNLVFIGLVFLFILIIGYFFFVSPIYSETIARKKAGIEAKEKELQGQLVYLEELKELKAEYESVELADKEKLDLILPKEEEIPEIYILLDILARESGLDLTGVAASKKAVQNQVVVEEADGQTASGPTLSSSLGILEVTLSVSGGNYDKLKIFLNKIERNIRLLDISSITFNSTEAYAISLKTYFQLEPSQASQATGQTPEAGGDDT